MPGRHHTRCSLLHRQYKAVSAWAADAGELVVGVMILDIDVDGIVLVVVC